MALALSILCALPWAQAAIPAGYYSPALGKKDAELKAALNHIIYPHTEVSSYSDLPKYFWRTDRRPNSDRWWDMYSDDPLYGPSFSGLNREHSVPKSWWGGLTTTPAYVDLYHLYPSEMKANTAKSNWPLGLTTGNSFDNGWTKVGSPQSGQGGGAQKVFEPADEYKGDFARTYFYFVTCYDNLTWKYTYMFSQNSYPTLNQWSVDLLMAWHRADPVSQKELDRNEVVYGIQNNRNPFIDYPELAEYLWGTKKGQAFQPGGVTPPPPSGDPELITPTQGMDLDFGQVAEGSQVQAVLQFRGKDITGNVEMRVYSGDKDAFTCPISRLAGSTVCGEYGTTVTLTYKPVALGTHTSKLLITVDDIAGSRGVVLRGECLPRPDLTAPTALAASNVTDTTYTANWESPADEVVDYWVVRRTRYTGQGDDLVDDITAEEPGLDIDDFMGNESYQVKSVRLGVESPWSNVVYVRSSGIADIAADMPMRLLTAEGGFVVAINETHTGGRLYDAQGRAVLVIAEVQPHTLVRVPAGIYFFATDQARPQRVIVI